MLNHRIKILHVLHSFNIGGLENGVINLINESKEDLFIHEICCVTKSGTAESRLKKSIKIHEMNKKDGNDWRMIPKLIKLIGEARPAIVHTRNWGTIDGIVAAKIKGVSSIIHGEHGWNIDDPQGQSIKRSLIRKMLSPAVNQFVAVSDDIRSWLIEFVGINERKVHKIVNGVDTKQYSPGNKIKNREKFGLQVDELVIGTVGRLDPIKDHRLLLEAFSKLDHKQSELKLIIVGDGPERKILESIRELLPQKNRILLLGERNDVKEILKMLDIYVLPSKNEGISNTILEAMATGIPVIASKVGGNPELIIDGETGILFPKENIEGLIGALNYYLEKPEQRRLHGLNARNDAERRFSIDRMVKQYEDLYMTLYNKKQII